MLGKVTDNCLRLWEHHETDGDRDRVDLWYRNITCISFSSYPKNMFLGSFQLECLAALACTISGPLAISGPPASAPPGISNWLAASWIYIFTTSAAEAIENSCKVVDIHNQSTLRDWT